MKYLVAAFAAVAYAAPQGTATTVTAASNVGQSTANTFPPSGSKFLFTTHVLL